MGQIWQEYVSAFGKSLSEAAEKHPEIEPLHMAWVNFAKKRGLPLSRHTEGNGRTGPKGQERYEAAIQAFADWWKGGEALRLVAFLKLSLEAKRLKAVVKRQASEIEALEYRIKTLMES